MCYKKISAQSKTNLLAYLKRVGEFKSLIFVLFIRDVKVKYVQTRLGIFWSFFQAVVAMLIIQFFFDYLLKVRFNDFPFVIYVFPGMIGWYYFSYIVTFSGMSLQQNQHLIKKIYFPKLILPIYRALVGLVDLFIWLIVYFFIMFIYSYSISLKAILLIIPIFLNVVVGLSFSIWLSAITIRYRDAFLIIPFLVGFGAFITPVFFDPALIPEKFNYLLYFNPMAGVIAMYRHLLLGLDFSMYYLGGFALSLILIFIGIFYFSRFEGKISDIL